LPNWGDIDPIEALNSLGFDQVDAIEPLLGGMDTLLWRFEAGGTFVLRLFRREQEEVAAKEIAIMRLLGDLVYPVPTVHGVGHWKRRPALVMDWVAGTTFSAALEQRPWSASALGMRFGRAQAMLHNLRPPLERLPNPLRSPKRTWIDWSHPDEHALRAELYGLPLQRQALIHLDFHPMNILTGPSEVAAVLDWAHVHYGDPRADVARTESILLLTPLQGTGRKLANWWFVSGWRQGYRSLRGPLADMALFRAWAGAAMLADLLPHRDTRGFPTDLFDDVLRWMERWKREAGLA
jgi:aminoglycoside phosphotransferase (APT) family kinase protein